MNPNWSIIFPAFILVPAGVLILYVILYFFMKRAKLKNPPYRDFFFIFASYTPLLILTNLFIVAPESYGLPHLLLFVYILFNAIFMLQGVFQYYTSRKQSKYHMALFIFSLIYNIIVVGPFALSLIAAPIAALYRAM